MLKLKDQVEIILTDYPKTRDSDVTLMIELWKKFYSAHIKKTADGQFGVYLSSLYTIPREDNIKRVRCVIQNDENRLLPTTYEVRKRRRINEDKWKQWIISNTEYKRI